MCRGSQFSCRVQTALEVTSANCSKPAMREMYFFHFLLCATLPACILWTSSRHTPCFDAPACVFTSPFSSPLEHPLDHDVTPARFLSTDADVADECETPHRRHALAAMVICGSRSRAVVPNRGVIYSAQGCRELTRFLPYH